MSTAVTTAVLCASNHPGRGTIADTIGASDRRTMLEAATTASAHAFISELPEGYDTPVGDGGVILSPSQRLRLSVARILATDPPAVLLDDPTAYLDAASEAAVLPGLEAVFRGRNVVVLDASPAVTAAARAAAEHAGQPSGPGAVRCPAPEPVPAPAAACALRPDPALPHLHELIDDHAMAPLLGAALEPGRRPGREGALGALQAPRQRRRPVQRADRTRLVHRRRLRLRRGGSGAEERPPAQPAAGRPGPWQDPGRGNRSRTSPRCPRSCSGCRSTSACRC